MDHKDIATNSSVSAGVSDGSTKFAHNSPTVQSRSKSYDVGSNSLGKVEATAARPCAIIGPDRVLPPIPDDTMYLKKMPGEAWPSPESIYRRPPEYPTKVSDYQPTRNISPRQTFQENMQRIMVPPTFSSMKGSEVSNLKNPKLNMPQEAKYCDVPYNVNSVNSEHKSVRNSDIPMSNVNPYTRNMPPPYGWPSGVNVRPLRPFGAPEFYQYQEFPSCAGPRPMTMIRPHRPLHEESAQVYSERLYQDANIRFKPYPTGKEKLQQPRYDHISNYPSTFHPSASLPPHKYDMQKSLHGHPYPVCPPVSYKYLDRRIHEPFVDGYHRSHSQQANFNAFHTQVVPPPYGPIPGSCMQNKTYPDASTKPINVNKIQFENNNKVYLNLESQNKNYSVPENLYFNDMNHSQAMRGEILLPSHSMLSIPPMPQHPIYRKDNTPLKPYDYNPNYRIIDQSVNVNHSLQRIPVQFSPNTVAISPSDSNDTAHTIGTSQEDCGYVSQSSTTSVRSFDSSNIPMPYDIYRRQSYNNYDMVRNTFHPIARAHIPKNKTSSSNKKNIDVRQFLQMWNEGDEEVSEGNKEAAAQSHAKKISSQSEIINNQEQLYVLGLVNVSNEDLGKYDHIQKISKLPENIKGYNSIEILNQYEELLETPHISNQNRSRDYNILSKSQIDKDITTRMPRPVSPLDVEAKISQSVIHKEVGCNFEIKPCSPQMLNVEVAAPVQNILGERMIEKVVNPIITKSPNFNRVENTVNDAINTASCKMINDQYASRTSPNRIKTNNYCLQDLERNAGLCLASLPQLDNDIELNFPEINQQFIKANQIESNISSGVQNLPHIDLEQKHHMLHETTRNDSRLQSISPQLACGPGLDKEFSKLSKYRKSRKLEITSCNDIIRQEITKSCESVAAQQRIDSVIIKNPDTNKSQDNETIKKTSETNYSFHKETQQPYSSMEYERNIQTYHLSSETAIDFSLNRSEDDTAVSYLKEIDRTVSQNLPPLEVFEGLNDGDDVSLTSGNIKEQNTSIKLNCMLSAVVVEDPKSPQFKISKENKKNEQNINQEELGKDKNENEYQNLKKVPDKSQKVNLVSEGYKALDLKNELSAKQNFLTIENITSTVNTEVTDTPELQNNHSKCQELDEETPLTSPVDTPKYKKYIKEVEPECTPESEKVTHLCSPVKVVIDNEDQFNSDKCLKNKVFPNKGSVITYDTKSFTDNNHITDNKTIEEVLNNLSDQDIDTLDTKSGSSFDKVNNDNNCENFTSSDNTLRKNEDIFEFHSNLSSFVTETDNETIGVVLGESDIGIVRAEDICIDINQPVASEFNLNYSKLDVRHNEESIEVEFQKNSTSTENKIRNTPDVMSSNTEKKSCDKNETDLQDLAIEITKYNPHTILESPEIKRDSKCISNKNDMNNFDKTVLSLSTEAFSEEMNNESTQSDYVKIMDVSDIDYLSNQSDPNSNVKLDSRNLKDDTESVTASTIELEESIKSIEASPTAVELKEDYETNNNIAESECLYEKAETENDNNIEKSCLLVKIPVLENSDAKVAECKQEIKLDGILNIEVEFECSSDKSCISGNAVENSCLPTEDIKYPENLTGLTAGCRHEPDIDDDLQTKHEAQLDNAEFELLSCKLHTNSTQPVKESNLTLNNKNPSVIILEHRPEIETENNKQKEFQTYVDKGESECISYNVEEHCVHISRETSPVNLRTRRKKEIKIKDNDLISAVKLDLNELDITDEFKDETKTMNIENDCLQSWKNQSQVSVINMGYTTCQKELFSPWFQKLLMFTEGICKSSENKNYFEQEDNSGKNIFDQEDASFVNVEIVFSENKNIDDLNSHTELRDVEKEPSLFNDIHITNEDMQSENVKKQVTVHDNGSLTNKYKAIKNDEMQLSADVFDNSAVKVKPRKICKRSLSESALEAFKDYDDINFVRPCKRKKGSQNNNSFLESNVITEDICNIIQTNRRNSISTFCNEDNVYIVIDNDIILTEESDDSDKLCYTENTEEFLLSIESTNCEINLNLENNSCLDESNQICEYTDSLHVEDKSIEDSWVDDVACIETVFSDDVAENIIIDVQASPEKLNSLDSEFVDGESNLFYDSDHIDKLKSIYGRTICNDSTQLIETLYRTPQMNVNKTLYHIESPDPKECLDAINERCLESDEHNNCSDILESAISSFKLIDNKENMTESLSLHSNQCNQDTYPNFDRVNHFKFNDFPTEEQEDKLNVYSCESSNNNVLSNIQKENSRLSCSSSPEVSSTTSEEKKSSILLKITNCNGSRVSQINQVNTDPHTKLSYKLTENREYQSYSSNFSSSRTLITKAAQKYIPPLKETIYDLKVKLPLPEHRLHSLKQLKIAKVKPKVDATASICTVKKLIHTSKKLKPKFEDVLKSIDEVHFKRHKDNIKKGKITIPKVIIKKNENGAHYASSKTVNRKETYNPDLTGRKWQPWVFLEKNNFVDRMALQNKAKAVYCHRKNSYVLLEKFRKYKSIYNANFVISQPKSETKGNLKYTIRLKHN